MSEPAMSPKELASVRLWRMSLARDQAVKALKQILDYADLWPEEAKRLDLDNVRGLWIRIEEGCRPDNH